MTTPQIEARALDLFNAYRDEVAAARGTDAAQAMSFTGKTRDSMMQLASEAIQRDNRVTAEDRFFAVLLAAMSDAQIATRLVAIDERIALLPYRPLTVVIADRGAGLADERRRLVAEQDRRAQFFGDVARALGVPALEAAE